MRGRSKSDALCDRSYINYMSVDMARTIYRNGFDEGRAQGFICGALLIIVVRLLL